LIPLRFEFDNEFRSRNPNEQPPLRLPWGTESPDSRPAVRRISAARIDAQTRQQRGHPITQDTGHLSCGDLDGPITPPSRSALQHAGPKRSPGSNRVWGARQPTTAHRNSQRPTAASALRRLV